MPKVCWILLQNLKLRYASNPHSHAIITCSDTNDLDLGGGPQDLKNWNSRRKRGECPINKTTKNFFIKIENNCKIYIVGDKLSFYKMRLLTSFFSYNTTGQFHGWMNTMGGCHNTTGQFHGGMNTMGGYHNTMGKYHGWMNTMGGCHLQYHGWINTKGGCHLQYHG